MTGHVISLCLSSHVLGHVQSQVVPSHGFILLDCGAVTPQWRNRLWGSRTIPSCYSDWLMRIMLLPLCYSHWTLFLDVSGMFLSAVFHSTPQVALSLP